MSHSGTFFCEWSDFARRVLDFQEKENSRNVPESGFVFSQAKIGRAWHIHSMCEVSLRDQYVNQYFLARLLPEKVTELLAKVVFRKSVSGDDFALNC